MRSGVSAFERAYRDVDIAMDDIFARDLRDPLMDGTYDDVCSFRLPGLNEEGLEFAPLLEMDACAWVSPDSELATRESTTLEELSRFTIRYMEPERSRLLTSYYRALFEQRGLDVKIGKPLTPTIYLAEDEFCLFPHVDAPAASLPDIVQVPIDSPAKLPVCWVRKRKTVNPLTDLFFEGLASPSESATD